MCPWPSRLGAKYHIKTWDQSFTCPFQTPYKKDISSSVWCVGMDYSSVFIFLGATALHVAASKGYLQVIRYVSLSFY